MAVRSRGTAVLARSPRRWADPGGKEPRPKADSTEPVARVDRLAVTFQRNGRSIYALRGVSLEVRPGEILGVVGESGSGKSVLGLSLLGLLPDEPRPDTAGSVTVEGHDMLTGSRSLRRRIRRDQLGAVFQDPMTSLNPTMRIGRQLVEAAGTVDEAVRLLRAVGVPDPGRRLGAFPHELSGGLRQRVMIAMAVAGSPSLVVADEPTTALDVTVQAQVLSLLRTLRDEGVGCSFVLITHDLGVAAQIADRIAVMYAGRLVEVGPTEDLIRAAAHPYSLGLMRSRLSLATDLARPLVTLRGEVPNPASPPPGCPFEPRCDFVVDGCATGGIPEPRAIGPAHLGACIRSREEIASPEASGPASEPDEVAVPEQAQSAAPAPAGVAARVRGVAKTFRVKTGRTRRARLAALREVDLEVAEGESVAIVGESGSGKSTLLRVIAGLEQPDHGELSLAPQSRPQMVFQDAGASLTPWLTAGELIAERLRTERLNRAARHARVEAALAQVGLPAETAGARASQLSGGQRQRVALARATVIPPKILLCDEPTSALDVSLAGTVINLIARLREQLGMALLFVTHDLSVARIVADRIAVMYLGQIVELGNADEIINRPHHPYTKALVSAIPDLGSTPAQLSGEPASPLDPPTGCAFHPRCPIAEDSCADPDLAVRLTRMPGEPDRRVACVRAGVN
jgi:peptide/nickel transport system ATP-binding protein